MERIAGLDTDEWGHSWGDSHWHGHWVWGATIKMNCTALCAINRINSRTANDAALE